MFRAQTRQITGNINEPEQTYLKYKKARPGGKKIEDGLNKQTRSCKIYTKNTSNTFSECTCIKMKCNNEQIKLGMKLDIEII